MAPSRDAPTGKIASRGRPSAAAGGKVSLDGGSRAICQLDTPDATPVRWLMKNLIIVGDPFHPPENQAPSLTAIMASVGIESDVEEDVEAGCRKLAGGRYNLLTFSAARWRMLNATS